MGKKEENYFGLKLREVRREKKMKQRDLSEASGIHPAMISHLEKGRRLPTYDTIQTLATALKINAGIFFQEA